MSEAETLEPIQAKLPSDICMRLRVEAARRGLRGFSPVIAEALDDYLPRVPEPKPRKAR